MRYFWKKVPGAHRSWGRINTLQSLKNMFKKNLDQNMLENALFLGEKMEKSSQRWRLRPQTSVVLRRLRLRPQTPKFHPRVVGYSARLVVGRLGFNSLAESDQKTLKVGIHSFPA